MKPSNQQRKNELNNVTQSKPTSYPRPVTTLFQRQEVEKRLAERYDFNYGPAKTTEKMKDVDLTSESLFENLYELLVYMSEYSSDANFKRLISNFTQDYEYLYAMNLTLDLENLGKFHSEIENITRQPGFFDSFELKTLNNLSEHMQKVENYLQQQKSSNRP